MERENMERSIRPVTDLKDAILPEQVRLAMRQLPTMQTASFLVALVLAYTVRSIIPPLHILVWILLVLGVAVSRIMLFYRFLDMSSESFPGEPWKDAYLLLALVSGIIWGLAAFIIFPGGHPMLISLFVLVIASLSAATTISHSSLRLGAAAWSVPALLLFAVRSARDGGEFAYTLSLLIVLYLLTILTFSLKHHASTASSIALKYENLDLLKELQTANEALRRWSAIDGLTGLANRRSFDETVEREWRRAMRDLRPVSMIMLDIDHFKLYNDNYGHQDGDDCLRRVASAITERVKRPADLAARFGGDEVVIVLPDSTLEGAADIAERIRRSVKALGIPHAHSSSGEMVTISVGVASIVPKSGTAPSQLIKLVDTALYSAKHSGRDRVMVA
jgi:diguanylate cyclase (GGDEF)-like protein